MASDFGDEVRRHRLDSLEAGVDERVLAEQVHDARDSARIKVGGVHGLRGEDGQAVSAGDVQARFNVLLSFMAGKRGSLTAQGDALFELSESELLEPVVELRLASEDDLQ